MNLTNFIGKSLGFKKALRLNFALFAHNLLLLVVIGTVTFTEGNTMPLVIGSKAPDFALLSSNGDTVRLSDFANKNSVVLIFYPGDATPGCTKQLCFIRDDFSKFEAQGAKVFGVNPADIESHKKFAKKQNYQFPLLVDDGRKIAKLYGCDAWPMVKRTVYAIDKKGIIVFAQTGMPSNEEILASIPGTSAP